MDDSRSNPAVDYVYTDDEIKEARAKLWEMGILEWKLDATQKTLYNFYKTGKEKTTVINCSRRLGKSYMLIILAFEQALQHPKSIIKFLQPEVKMIRTNIRPIIDEITVDCPPEYAPEFRTQDNIYYFKNGSQIQLAGTDNGNYMKLRGGNSHLALIDEAGFCTDLKHIIDYILIPTTTLTKGRIILSSTTPPDPAHEFIGYMSLAQTKSSFIKKTILDAVEDSKNLPNPRFTQEIVEEIVNSIDGGKDSDSFRTEYLCVDELTKIRTSSGFKYIKDIKVGESVYTHKGRFKKVLNTFKHKLNDKKVFYVKCSNNEGFYVTEGHQLYVTIKNWKGSSIFTGWKNIEDINMDSWTKVYFNNPINKLDVTNDTSEDLAYLSGWYAAEGHCASKAQQVIFSLSQSDPSSKLSEIAFNIFGKNFKNYTSNKSLNCQQYALNSKKAKDLFLQFGNNSKTKIIPDYIKNASRNAKLKFIQGYLEGDGCIINSGTGNTLQVTTTSEFMAYDFSELLLSLNIQNSIKKTIRPKTAIIQGRLVNQSDIYNVSILGEGYNILTKTEEKGTSKHIIEEDRFLSKITTIEEVAYNKPYVYDIEVEEDHSYTSLHATFHNCEIIHNSDSAVVPEFNEEVEKDCVAEWQRPPFVDNYVSMDIGFRDMTFIIFGYYDFYNAVVVIEDELCIKGTEVTAEKVDRLIRQKEDKYFTNAMSGEFVPPYKRVSDNNLIFLNDLLMTYNMQFFPTDKHNKDSYINKMRTYIQSRKIIINPRCVNLIEHLKNATWDKTKKEFKRSNGHHFDGVDALAYLIRNLDESRNPYPKNFKYSGLGNSDNVFYKEAYFENKSNYKGLDKLNNQFAPKSSLKTFAKNDSSKDDDAMFSYFKKKDKK